MKLMSPPNKNQKKRGPNIYQNNQISERELLDRRSSEFYLIAGDFNIDCIEDEQKPFSRDKGLSKLEVEKFICFYTQQQEINPESEVVQAHLQRLTRYDLMMALLNSGRMRIFDVQKDLFNKFFVTFGEAHKDEKSGEYFSKEKTLYAKHDQMSHQGLDYIMVGLPFSSDLEDLPVEILRMKKREFLVESRPYRQMSDHLGLELVFRIK